MENESNDAVRAEPISNPWREFIENCISGDNYFRTSEWHALLADLDRLYAKSAAHAAQSEALASQALRVENLKDLVRIQCSQGTWDYDEYMRGMANGLLVAMSVFDDKDPVFKEALPKAVQPAQQPGDVRSDLHAAIMSLPCKPLIPDTGLDPVMAHKIGHRDARHAAAELAAIAAARPSAPTIDIAAALHYPACWDVAAYSTVADALSAVYDHFKCSECAPAYTEDPMDIVRTVVCMADRMAELTDKQREFYPSPLSDMSPLMQAARRACVERGFTDGGLSIDPAADRSVA